MYDETIPSHEQSLGTSLPLSMRQILIPQAMAGAKKKLKKVE